MRLILTSLPIAVVVGYLLHGRLSNLATVRLRFPLVALAGIAMQFVVADGTLGYLLLVGSFAFLIVFATVNLKERGFALIFIGLALNLTVIAVNKGMPVTRFALVASGQGDTLEDLQAGGGSKHHLASDRDSLMLLADIIPVPAPVRQAISVGDIAAHAGVAWFVIEGMRRKQDLGFAAEVA